MVHGWTSMRALTARTNRPVHGTSRIPTQLHGERPLENVSRRPMVVLVEELMSGQLPIREKSR
jgi:hypothetical protein